MARDTLRWQHLDLDGKKIENGKRYVMELSWVQEEGTIWWNARHGYMFRREGTELGFSLPFDYRGNRVCVYKVRRVE